MTPYLIIFAIVAVLAFANMHATRANKTVFVLLCVGIGVFVGISDMLGGYDRYIYCEVFEVQSRQVRAGASIFNPQFMRFFGHEQVYGLINTLIGYFTENRYVFVMVYTVIMYILLAFSILRYTKDPFFALMIFMGLMFFFSFTYLRQVMAAIILWFSLPYIAKRQYLPFFALVLTATLVHNSAMYFALLYFIPRKKFPTQNIIIVMGILLFIGIFFSAASLFTFYGDVVESAASKAAGYENLASSDVRIAYIIESLLFLGILFANYDRVGTSTSDCVITNAYLMFCGVLLLFCRSTDGGRIAWHSAIGVILLITRLCEKRNTDLLRVFMITVSFALFFRILVAWGMLLSPYKTCFTPGHREGDECYMHYEYNHQYDIDKFYNL